MSSATNVSSGVLLRYASSLIDLAEESKALNKVEKDLGELQSMLSKSADLLALVQSPLVGRGEQKAVVLEIAKKARFHDLTGNFLGVLSDNRRLYLLEGIIGAFYGELSRRRGEVTASVQTARKLSAKQQKDLVSVLSKAVGADVKVDTIVDPSILGGMVVTIGSHMIDDSVVRKIERLKLAMGKSSNENTTTKKEVA